MSSPTQWTWVWASSERWWWTDKPGMLQSMGSQSIGHDWVTELNWIELCFLEWHISKAFIIKCLFSTWYCAKLCSHIISFNCNNPVRYYYCLYFKDAETKTQTDRWLRQVLTLVLVPEPLVLNSFVTLLTLNEMRKSTGSMVDGKHCKYKRD